MALDPTDPTASGVSADPSPTGTAPAPSTYSKEDLTRITAREVAKERAAAANYQRERDELAARLTELEAKAHEAEESKLSATQRAENERKREREKLEAERETWKSTATRERSLRHDALTSEAATRMVSSLATRFSHADLARDAARDIRSHLVVQADADGAESVMWQHAPGDTVPVGEGFKAFEAAGSLARFYRVEGGSGAQHGAGAAGVRATFAGLSPNDKIAAGLSALKR